MAGILIVDDYASIRHLLRLFVETNTGFEVCGEAENSAEAIAKAKDLQPDLVLLDMTMPSMTGAEAGPLIKRLLPQVKIILFTIHTDGVNQALASSLGIDLAISKSEGIKNLREHLIALLTSVDSPARAADLRKNTRINWPISAERFDTGIEISARMGCGLKVFLSGQTAHYPMN